MMTVAAILTISVSALQADDRQSGEQFRYQYSAPTDSIQMPPLEFPPGVSDGLHAVIKPSQYAEISPLVPGLIRNVHVREGQYVSAGEILITLDDRIAEARLAAATAEAELTGGLHRAEIELQMAERHLQRLRSAVLQGAGADFELDEAEAARDRAQASVEQQLDLHKTAAARRDLVAAQLNQLKIIAPFDGLVTDIQKRSGTVTESKPLISLANLDDLEIEMHLSTTLFGQIRRGQQLFVTAGVPVNHDLPATVQSVSPILDSATDTFRCLLHVDNRHLQIPAGVRVVLNHRRLRSATNEPQASQKTRIDRSDISAVTRRRAQR